MKQIGDPQKKKPKQNVNLAPKITKTATKIPEKNLNSEPSLADLSQP
jgi:hypothetical protein